MKIRNITINSFGKLSEYSLDLRDGVNVIYGPNEYGKTTIMEFIKIIFYGKNEKSAQDKLIREKYKPWDGSAMSGSIEFEQGGQIYKIQKEISEKSARNDKTVVRNISAGEVIKLGKDEEVGEHFFGIDVKSFERSSYIKNLGSIDFESAKSSKNSKDTLADKMFSNLLETGDEDVSQSGVIAKIKGAMKDLKTPTGRGGSIRTLEKEICDLKQKTIDLNNFEKGQEDIKKELESLSALIKEQKAFEIKIKKFDEHKRIKETLELAEMASKKEKLREKAAEFGIDFGAAEEVFDKFEQYRKNLEEISTKIENIKNFSENRGNNSPKISEEEKNRFESMSQRIEDEKEKSELLKYLTPDNFSEYKSDKFDFSENLENIGLEIKNSEKLKALKAIELEKAQSKSKKINGKFLIADGMLLLFSVICMFANLFSLLPFVFGFLLFILAAHLCYFCRAKKICKNLENEISEKNSEIENLKSNFNFEIEKIKSETEKNLKNSENEIKNLLSGKKCSNRNEFYQSYAKSREREDFEAVLKAGENSRKGIIENLKKFLDSAGIRIDANKFCETLDFLKELYSKYIGISSEINYKAGAINIHNTDSQSLKRILEETSCHELDFEIGDIDGVRSRFAELEKMNLHAAYMETQKKIINTSEDPEKLKSHLEKLILKKQKMEKYYESLGVALEAFEEVSDELRRNFNPKLNSRASEIFKSLTGGKYDNLYIQRDYDFIVGGETLDRYSRYFSSGTVDQAYLASRIAISELISSAKIPLIFDDTLMQYDDERLKNAIDFLKNYAETSGVQSVIFTCHDCIKNIS